VAKVRTTNPRQLRLSNRASALAAVYLDGPMTRLGIASAAGVSPATVSNLVGELLQQGAIIESGAQESAGGRPRVLLQMNPDYGYVIGVDVGETAVLVELFDLQMRVRASHSATPLSAGLDPAETVAQVLEGIASVVADAGVPEDRILGVGVGVPGLVKHGDEVHAQTLGWDGVPLGRMLRAGTALPLVVDNGVTTFGQAEKWFGAGRDVDNTIMVLLGTGVGITIFAEGEQYRGASSSAGEWGHTTVMVGGRECRCGAFGCLEAYIGGRSVVTRYDQLRRRRPADSGSDLVQRMRTIATARPADRSAATVLDETAAYLGAGIADLVNLFNPERIIVGGWVAQMLGEPLLVAARDVASRHALAMPFRDVSIVAAKLGRDSVALGAATLPVSDWLASGAVRPDGQALSRGR
jgi:predicted NBD/HSP70 family sugar kinase